ncbi:MAG TPA: hypothetical protein PKG96_06400 [Bacilli bacterium]|nr:hypothetical protein [Bacilli bacterium]
MQLKQFEFLVDLEKNYDHNPAICYYCGKPLSFKKFYSQYELSKKFCCKKCKSNYLNETGDSKEDTTEFSSQTEKTIYTYLTLQYPSRCITHNLLDVFPPYEIDFCILNEDEPLYIEYNGSLHCTRKQKGIFKRTVQKHQINDRIKKIELCENRKHSLIRLWSEIGLYSNPNLFNSALKKLSKTIDDNLNNPNIIQCNEIIVDKYGEFHEYVEQYGER